MQTECDQETPFNIVTYFSNKTYISKISYAKTANTFCTY